MKADEQHQISAALVRAKNRTPSGVWNYDNEREKDNLDFYRNVYRDAALLGFEVSKIGSTDISIEREWIVEWPNFDRTLNIHHLAFGDQAFDSGWVNPVLPIVQGQGIAAEFDAEVDRIAPGREGAYAKLALARSQYATDELPKVSKSPEGGIVLQSSSNKGSANLIFEGDQAILVRTTDDFTVQVTCNLNPVSVNELLEIYEAELSRI